MTTAFVFCVLYTLIASTASWSLESYLDWPRIHFNGSFRADESTVNNMRCFFENEKFTPTNQMKGFPILSETNTTKASAAFHARAASWNPEGTHHFQFVNAVVRSFCGRDTKACHTDASIVGRTVRGDPYGVFVDLDTDWQISSEIYGMKLVIDSILEANLKPAGFQVMSPRGRGLATRIKSVLQNVTWRDAEYEKVFESASELSIVMLVDQYCHPTHVGRVTATIGLRSSTDPQTTVGYRAMYPSNINAFWKNLGMAPFNIIDDIMLLDLSLSVNADLDGRFLKKDVGELFLMSATIGHNLRCQVIPELKDQKGTENVTLPVGDNNDWYDVYGGVLQLNISQLSLDREFMIVQKHPVSNKSEVVFAEMPYGVRFTLMEDMTTRHSPGETFTWNVFVSKRGLPAIYDVQMNAVTDFLADTDCTSASCDRRLGQPSDALQVRCTSDTCGGGVATTNEQGIAQFTITTGNPGNPRGCGLDGQVYPIVIRAYAVDDPFEAWPYEDGVPILSENAYRLNTMPMAIAVYGHVGLDEIVKPTWQDVKGIFQQYHNLYPVMSTHAIVDLGSYDGVTAKASQIRRALELPVSDVRYMPITRDLSPAKRDMIFRWMDNGMPRYPSTLEDAPAPQCINSINELKRLLQTAATLELTTIPPYFTAWLSLQTEFGKNTDIADIIKSVFIEEMFHLSFASNILSAIGGQVKLTDFSNVPAYPTSLAFGATYELGPFTKITVERFSIGQVADIFSAIESPENHAQQTIFRDVARLTSLARIDSATVSPTAEDFVQFYSFKSEMDDDCKTPKDEKHRWACVKRISSTALSNLRPTNISTIGAFYSYVALNLAFMESCAKSGEIAATGGTIFKSSSQISDPGYVFPVTNLHSALDAIINIVYEGEGGSECSPFVSQNSSELSHYYRFQEIVYGRKLERVNKTDAKEIYACLNLSTECGSDSDIHYCYSGEKLPYHETGIWPIIANAKNEYYEDDSDAARLSKYFNIAYTDILFCIDDIFAGSSTLFQCITRMHDLAIVGKRLVATKLDSGPFKGQNAAPTWSFVLRQSERSGLPLNLPQQTDVRHCTVSQGGNASPPLLPAKLLGMPFVLLTTVVAGLM